MTNPGSGPPDFSDSHWILETITLCYFENGKKRNRMMPAEGLSEKQRKSLWVSLGEKNSCHALLCSYVDRDEMEYGYELIIWGKPIYKSRRLPGENEASVRDVFFNFNGNWRAMDVGDYAISKFMVRKSDGRLREIIVMVFWLDGVEKGRIVVKNPRFSSSSEGGR